jgi:hypothetical protein
MKEFHSNTTHTTRDNFLIFDVGRDALHPNLIKPTPQPLIDVILRAENWAAQALPLPLRFHISRTHSWKDTLRQCRIAAVGIHDYESIEALCRSIIWLHLVDDLKEAAKISIDEFLFSFKQAFHSREVFPQPESSSFFENRQLSFRLTSSFHNIYSSLQKEDVEWRKKLYFFGLQKMLWGDILFEEKQTARFQHQMSLSALLSETHPENLAIQSLLKNLDPLYVAFTVNSLFETIEVFKSSVPAFHLIQLQNLIYGPIVNIHDLDLEIAREGRSKETVPTLHLIKHSYYRILAVTTHLPKADQELIWARFPWILEAFSKTLPKEIRHFFAELLTAPDIRSLLTDWNDHEIQVLHHQLTSPSY